jgi:hypothetical protein
MFRGHGEAEGRCLDLSAGVARAIELRGAGVVHFESVN